ncbi:dimethylargininase [Strigomonas culicis]|uniref:Dimethylargininase n=1 Tax=Strigomonas culicis TaxID=28005 RepID=S9VUT0_9TRYP|nr:dimethylargininase [Strigomonas culicis]|eukprot:EPY30936.1 dimethylargininase [Strigomonas culicis]
MFIKCVGECVCAMPTIPFAAANERKGGEGLLRGAVAEERLARDIALRLGGLTEVQHDVPVHIRAALLVLLGHKGVDLRARLGARGAGDDDGQLLGRVGPLLHHELHHVAAAGLLGRRLDDVEAARSEERRVDQLGVQQHHLFREKGRRALHVKAVLCGHRDDLKIEVLQEPRHLRQRIRVGARGLPHKHVLAVPHMQHVAAIDGARLRNLEKVLERVVGRVALRVGRLLLCREALQVRQHRRDLRAPRGRAGPGRDDAVVVHHAHVLHKEAVGQVWQRGQLDELHVVRAARHEVAEDLEVGLLLRVDLLVGDGLALDAGHFELHLFDAWADLAADDGELCRHGEVGNGGRWR